MANLTIPMKVEVELSEEDRKLLQRFVDAVESMQEPTIKVPQFYYPELGMFGDEKDDRP